MAITDILADHPDRATPDLAELARAIEAHLACASSWRDGAMTDTDTTAFPTLSADEIDRVASLRSRDTIGAGDFVFVEGQPGYDFVLILDGEVDVLARAGDDRTVVASHGAGRFLGELSLLTGQRTTLAARARTDATIVRLDPDRFRSLMANDADLSDLIFSAFLPGETSSAPGPGQPRCGSTAPGSPATRWRSVATSSASGCRSSGSTSTGTISTPRRSWPPTEPPWPTPRSL